LTGHGTRRAALGEALAGFGLFFLGAEIMQTAFQNANLPVQGLAGSGISGTLLFLGIGFALTVIMQSSSAAMALILVAVAGGFVTINAAAAAVIGANVGTTTTGLLAVFGATPNTKRVAASHLIFNMVTGLVALLILPFLLGFIYTVRTWLQMPLDPPAVLAVFHTVFNFLGVLLPWKFTPGLIRFQEIGQFAISMRREGLGQNTAELFPQFWLGPRKAGLLRCRHTGGLLREMVFSMLKFCLLSNVHRNLFMVF
jgi:phosphate:Na+ symporter